MKVILLSGGAGERLWPLSGNIRSKQFIKLLTSPDGTYESMIQRVTRQIKNAGLSDDMIVVTGEHQKELTQMQLGNKTAIVPEPYRRDTFTAIYLACAYLFAKGIDLNESIIVFPCDSFVDDEYFHAIHRLDEIIKKDIADIALIGIIPTYPTSNYGYIVCKDKPTTFSNVSPIIEFVEKPDTETAEKLIKNGAMWNAGTYAFKLDYLLNLGSKYFKSTDYDELIAEYGDLPKLSFSYEILEKIDNKCAIPFKGLWKDIGTWDTFTNELNFFEHGNVRTSKCHNSYVINGLEKPLICVGCDNMIVVASVNGILVTNKDQCEDLKHLLH